jgi:hypothetical protein
MVKTPDGKSSHLACSESRPPDNLYSLEKLGLRILPEEALASFGSFGPWPAESPNVDLLQGVKTHNFALVTWALENGADVNFRSPHDAGVLGSIAHGRYLAIHQKRVAEFDEETDRLLDLLLSHGASPTQQDGRVINFLATRVPNRTIYKLLATGWPDDYNFRLYVGALLGDPVLVKESLDHGADPNTIVHGRTALSTAIGRASQVSHKGDEAEQAKALAALEHVLKAGAKIDEGTSMSGNGNIVQVYSYSGHMENIRAVLELLIQYATPAARKNSLDCLKAHNPNGHPQKQANLAWLINRLASLIPS